ncbi:MAG: hypothetical protein KA436_08305 [Oligoflexales bacterium]|nr:hypothetical protein [Oligoflexales bacterium]
MRSDLTKKHSLLLFLLLGFFTCSACSRANKATSNGAQKNKVGKQLSANGEEDSIDADAPDFFKKENPHDKKEKDGFSLTEKSVHMIIIMDD